MSSDARTDVAWTIAGQRCDLTHSGDPSLLRRLITSTCDNCTRLHYPLLTEVTCSIFALKDTSPLKSQPIRGMLVIDKRGDTRAQTDRELLAFVAFAGGEAADEMSAAEKSIDLILRDNKRCDSEICVRDWILSALKQVVPPDRLTILCDPRPRVAFDGKRSDMVESQD